MYSVVKKINFGYEIIFNYSLHLYTFRRNIINLYQMTYAHKVLLSIYSVNFMNINCKLISLRLRKS